MQFRSAHSEQFTLTWLLVWLVAFVERAKKGKSVVTGQQRSNLECASGLSVPSARPPGLMPSDDMCTPPHHLPGAQQPRRHAPFRIRHLSRSPALRAKSRGGHTAMSCGLCRNAAEMAAHVRFGPINTAPVRRAHLLRLRSVESRLPAGRGLPKSRNVSVKLEKKIR